LPKKTKPKPRLPTQEEFLALRPQRCEFEWFVDDEQKVVIKVPKFQREIGKKVCKILKKDNTFNARMDDIGSLVWQFIDGRKTVQEVLNQLKKQFPDQKNIDQRLIFFLQQMHHLNYLTLN
jgi:hypothetical protein